MVEREPNTLRRSPSEYFIRYYLTMEQEMAPEQVVADMEFGGHVMPDDPLGYVMRMSAELEERMPDPFRPNDLRHAASQMFLQRERIWDMWHPNRIVLDAARMQETEVLREQARAMLAAGFNHPAVASVLSQLQENFLEDSVRLFEHYFWNMRIFTVLERERLFLHGRAGTVAFRARIAGSRIAGKSQVLEMLGHHVASTDQRRSLHDFMIHAQQLMPRVDEERDVLRQSQALLNHTAVFIQASRRAEEVGGAVSSAAEHAGLTRRTPTIFTETHLRTPNVELPRLPGRVAHLRVVEDAEVVESKEKEDSGGS